MVKQSPRLNKQTKPFGDCFARKGIALHRYFVKLPCEDADWMSTTAWVQFVGRFPKDFKMSLIKAPQAGNNLCAHTYQKTWWISRAYQSDVL